jgi:hypothetical protein
MANPISGQSSQELTLEQNLFINQLGWEEAKEFSEIAVLCIFVNMELEIPTAGLMELEEVVLVLCNLTEKFQAFLWGYYFAWVSHKRCWEGDLPSLQYLMKFRYSGIRSMQLSMIKTWET